MGVTGIDLLVGDTGGECLLHHFDCLDHTRAAQLVQYHPRREASGLLLLVRLDAPDEVRLNEEGGKRAGGRRL